MSVIKIFAIFSFFSILLNAQWLGGAGYEIKSSVPEKGGSVFLIKKLPFQSPSLGINLKSKLSYFFSEESLPNRSTLYNSRFNEYYAAAMLEAVVFSGFFQPYISAGIGGGIISSAVERGFFTLNADIGVKLLYNIQPFIGIHVRYGFPRINDLNGIDIRSFAVSGMIGLLFNL